MSKKAGFKLLGTAIMLSVMGITALAANPTSLDTPVKYVGIGTNTYEVSVPSILYPETDGDVSLWGTWDSTKKVTVSTDEYIVMTNNIDGKTKNIVIDFDNIVLDGNNTTPVEKTETITVGEITDALFGTWSGTISYNIQLTDIHIHTWDTEFTVDLAPTCTTVGSKSIHCSSCTEVKDITEVPAEHTWNAEYTIDKPATCTVAGSKSIHCSKCTATKNTTTITEKGHSYGTPIYTWNGLTSCTATRTCLNDASHKETGAATVTNTITTQPKCTTTGVRTYTATFSNSAFATQKKTASIAATGHLYKSTKCSNCNTKIADGLYNSAGTRLCSMAQSGIDITKTLTQTPDTSFNPYLTDPTSTYCVVTNKYKTTTMVVVQDGITGFGWNTFYMCKFLKQVILPDSVTSLSIAMFLESSVEKVNIPDNVTYITTAAFGNCVNLKEIYYKGVTYTGEKALTNALKANGVTVESGVFTGSSFAGK